MNPTIIQQIDAYSLALERKRIVARTSTEAKSKPPEPKEEEREKIVKPRKPQFRK